MWTEEDTIRRLKKIPLEQLEDLIYNHDYNHWASLYSDDEYLTKFLEKYGWTLTEYRRA